MAITFGAKLGEAASQASSTTLVITTSVTATVGQTIIVRVAADNLTTTTPTFTCADSAGNTYTVDLQAARGTVGAGVAGAIISAPVTTQLASGGTITITMSGAVVAKAAMAHSFNGMGAYRALGSDFLKGGSTGANVTSGSIVADEIAIGMAAVETRTAPSAYDVDTVRGNWSTGESLPSIGSGTDTSAVLVVCQHKIVTADGTQTFNSGNVNTDWIAFIAVFTPTSVSTFTATGASTDEVDTAAGAGTFANPTLNGAGAATDAHDTAAAAGTFTAPTFTGSSSASDARDTAGGSAAFTLPVYTATGSATDQPDTGNGTGTHAAPEGTGTGAAVDGLDTLSGSATFTAPIYAGAGASTDQRDTASGTATFTAATEGVTGAGAPVDGLDTLVGSATFTAPVYAGSGVATDQTDTLSGSATFTVPTFTGVGAATDGRDTAVGTENPPVDYLVAVVDARRRYVIAGAVRTVAIVGVSHASTVATARRGP